MHSDPGLGTLIPRRVRLAGFLTAALLLAVACVVPAADSEPSAPPSLERLLQEASRREASGDFRDAETFLARALETGAWTRPQRDLLAFERDRFQRIRRDYRLTREQLRSALDEALENFTAAEFERWIGEGRFDRRQIDGGERFFASSVSNLFFRYPDLEARRKKRKDHARLETAHWENAMSIRAAARAAGSPYVLPKRFEVKMSVAVEPGTLTPGEAVSAWLPVPRTYPHQDGFELRRTSPANPVLAPPDSAIRSVFLQGTGAADGSARFDIEYTYTARGIWFDLDPARARAVAGARTGAAGAGGVDAAAGSGEAAEAGAGPGVDPLLEPWLGEGPHVVFSPAMRRLAEQLAGGETNVVRRARRFYEWIASNIRYSYAPEYSTLRSLAEKCHVDGHGDCGQAALLFMTLCRLSGVPARWQSGWAIFPGDETIHDWCEIHLEPWGWVPVDPYMGMYAMQYATTLSPSQRQELRDFYFGGLTQYRMAANRDHQQPLTPPKRWMRSDPVDFQRGEVETPDRNLYFDRFRYDLEWEEEPVH